MTNLEQSDPMWKIRKSLILLNIVAKYIQFNFGSGKLMAYAIETPLDVQPTDVPAIIELLRQLYGGLSKEPTQMDVHSTIMSCRVAFARHESGIVGMARLVTFERFGTRGAWFEDVVVFQHMRRQGIASALVHKLEEIAAELGVSSLQLLTFKDRPEANGFWQSLGYELRTDRVIRRKML